MSGDSQFGTPRRDQDHVGSFAAVRPQCTPGSPVLPAPPGGPGYGPVSVLPYAPPPGSTRLPSWAIVVMALAASLVVVVIVSAVAVPVFLDQRARAAAITVSMPPSLDGLQRVTDDPVLERLLATMVDDLPDSMADRRSAAYSDPERTHNLLVVAGTFSVAPDLQYQHDYSRGFWDGFVASAGENGVHTGAIQAMEPGSLGGTLSCAALSGVDRSGWVCLSISSGATTMTLDIGGPGVVGPTDTAQAQRVREAVEHRG